MNAQPGVKVAVCDPLPLVRDALCRALTHAGYRAEESPVNVAGWVRRAGRCVVVFSLAGVQGFKHLDEILSASDATTVVALVEEASPDVFAAIMLRGRAYPTPRYSDAEEVVEAVNCALAQVVRLPGVIAESLADRAYSNNGAPPPLESKELVWMSSLASGTTVQEIATEAGYSERAMYRRLAGIYRRLGVPNRSLAIARLAEAGLIDYKQSVADENARTSVERLRSTVS